MRGRILAGAACVALAAVAAPAFAQAPPSLTWVAYAQGKPGKTTEWLKLTLKHDAPIYDKRRYAIPLARLAQIVPTISLARLRDVTDAYQPFCEIDQEARYQFLDAAPPLLAQGLVYDKTTGAYL